MTGTNCALLLTVILLPFAAAVISYICGRFSKKLRDIIAALLAAAELALTLTLALQPAASLELSGICGLGLSFELTGFNRVYSLITAFAWMMTVIFSREYLAHYRNRNRYYLFTLLTLGAAQGVFLAADLASALVFFEVMSFTSYAWVAHDETEGAMRAAGTYLGIAVIGGLAAMMGLFLFSVNLGTLRISELGDAFAVLRESGAPLGGVYAGAGCILAGFGAKAGLFPLHIWLPKAHPVAPAPTSALLSGVLTKTGVFGAAVLTCRLMSGDLAWATVILILAAVTMTLGALMALFSTDLKRTLACSSMSQIGFIMVGFGCCGILESHGGLAARGAVLHMANHTLIKLVLFIVAGTVYMNLHKLDLNAIRGYGRKKPLLAAAFLCGALGIAGFPLFNGYLSKSLLHEGIVECIAHFAEHGHPTAALHVLEWAFLGSGGITLAYMTKLFVAIFVEKNGDPMVQAKYDESKFACSSPVSFAVIGISAVLLPILGIFPNLTAGPLSALAADISGITPHGDIAWFSGENLKGAAISIAIGFALYFGIVRPLLMSGKKGSREYVNRIPAAFDLENAVYRPVLLKILPAVFGTVCEFFDRLPGLLFGGKFLSFVGSITHLTSDLLDFIIILLRRTIYHDSPAVEDSKYEHTFAYRFGAHIDRRRAHHKLRNKNYAEHLVDVETTISDTTHRLAGSMSFALLMLCAGLTAVFIYLLFLK